MEKNTLYKRLHFIELIAYWEGRVNSGHLIEHFNLSRQQSSADLNQYRTLAPGNLTYNPSLKAWLPNKEFSPKFITSDVAEYLTWAQTGQSPYCLAPQLSAAAVNFPARKVSPDIIRNLVTAIKQQRRIEVDYVSLNAPDRSGRVIAPHSFVNTGLRWHLRAWCEKSTQYRDFVLSRFRGDVELLGKSAFTQSQDEAWNTLVTIILEPDPRLTANKKEVLENDYQMQNGQLHIATKACFVQYLLRELQVNTKMLDGTPEAQQLVCVNLADIKPWLFE